MLPLHGPCELFDHFDRPQPAFWRLHHEPLRKPHGPDWQLWVKPSERAAYPKWWLLLGQFQLVLQRLE